MIASRLYRLLWLILHYLACTYETLHWISCQLHVATLWSYDIFRSRTSIVHRDRAFLERCKAQLTKLPRHLSIIVGSDDNALVNEEVLMRIFRYALVMNIDCISLFDARLADGGHIRLEKLRPPKGVHFKQLQEHRFIWSTPNTSNADATVKCKTEIVNGCANGTTNGHLSHSQNLDKSIEIFEITNNDGRPLIAAVCRKLFQQRHNTDTQELLKDRTRLTQRINDELTQSFSKISDPELCIIFNRYTCTFGMLPWHTRFTEFHTHETGRNFNAETFARVLFRYARCEQRWGK